MRTAAVRGARGDDSNRAYLVDKGLRALFDDLCRELVARQPADPRAFVLSFLRDREPTRQAPESTSMETSKRIVHAEHGDGSSGEGRAAAQDEDEDEESTFEYKQQDGGKTPATSTDPTPAALTERLNGLLAAYPKDVYSLDPVPPRSTADAHDALMETLTRVLPPLLGDGTGTGIEVIDWFLVLPKELAEIDPSEDGPKVWLKLEHLTTDTVYNQPMLDKFRGEEKALHGILRRNADQLRAGREQGLLELSEDELRKRYARDVDTLDVLITHKRLVEQRSSKDAVEAMC
eukprot:gene24147-40531_t